jgi:TetR/AcrR family transcriptional regulator, transcriptional repressor for nem operon
MLDNIESINQSHPARRAQAQLTRDKLVQEGIRQVLERGWAGTGIDVVLRQCQVPKGSFYYYFESKEAFCYACLEAYQAARLQHLQHWLVHQPTNSLEQLCAALEGMLAETTAQLEQDQFQRGCMVGALGQEVASLHEGIRLRLLACVAQWEDILAKAIFSCLGHYEKQSAPARKNTKTGGLFDFQAFSAAQARAFWVAWQGALLHSLIARDAQALHVVVQQLQQRLMDAVLQTRGKPLGAKSTADIAVQSAQKPLLAAANSGQVLPQVVDKVKKPKKSSKIKVSQASLDF